MRLYRGMKVLTYRRRVGKRHLGNTLPRSKEKWFVIELRAVWVLVAWYPWKGYYPVALLDAEDPKHPEIENWGHPRDVMPIKRRVPAGELPQVPALSIETKLFAKLPNVMEFLAATAYAEGHPRTPGYYSMRNRLVEYELTFYDPDGGVRLVTRHRDHDKCWFAAEVLLGADEAPWEVDRYLFEQLKKKPKKKK